MLAWYVVVAKENQDNRVARGLRDQKFPDVYLAKTFEKMTTAKGGKRPAGSLLFSPYVFVLFDAARDEHAPIRNTRGVESLLSDASGNPLPIRDGVEFIRNLRQAEDDELCGASVHAHREDLKRGVRVFVDKPNLLLPDGDELAPRRIEGKISRFVSRHRVEVLVGNCPWTVDEVDVSLVA